MILQSKTRNLRYLNRFDHALIANEQTILQKSVRVVPMPPKDPNGTSRSIQYPAQNPNDDKAQEI